jgi:PhzF family phenazine biosynthesis protein
MLEIALEDPATGSAACALGSYLALKGKRTRKFEVTQGVEMGRESVIGVEVVIADGGREVESVRLSGSAVQVMEGSLRI